MKKENLKLMKQVLNRYQVKTKTIIDQTHATLKELSLDCGQAIPKHQFPLEVVFIVLEGKGMIGIGSEVTKVSQYDVVYCPPNTEMYVKADEDSILTFLNLKAPGLPSLKKK